MAGLVRAESVERIAVLGAGTMGHGIAQACAQAGCQVILRDVDEELLRAARDRFQALEGHDALLVSDGLYDYQKLAESRTLTEK